MINPFRRRSGAVRSALGLIVVSALVTSIGACGESEQQTFPDQAAVVAPVWGVYAGPGRKGVTGAEDFAATSGVQISRILDFLPDDSWDAMAHAQWLLQAHSGSRYRLELSVPMLPAQGGGTLEDCAGGADNAHWRTIATELRKAHLGSTTIRPGWEFNGDWYRWSAAGPSQAGSYAGCFRQLVAAMRSVSPELTFSWSVNVGVNRLAAELGWPGDDDVDVVGVDVYDYSKQWYPAPHQMTIEQARLRAWDATLNGDHGLRFWSEFANSHNKPLALSEWGLAWRADGHAGGDNTHFVDGIVAFVRDPANRVVYATYFNSADTPELKHDIVLPNTRFPSAARRFRQLAGG